MNYMAKKYFSLLGYLYIFIAAHLFTYADIPYVQGVDYIPQHYSGYYNGENKNFAISDDDIEKDIHLIAQNFDAIRTYEYDPINLQRILRAAKRYQLKVAVGLDINPDNSEYTNFQLNGLNDMFTHYPDLLDPVIAVVMGNNVIGHGKKTEQDIKFLLLQMSKISSFEWLKNSKIVLGISENAETLLNTYVANELFARLPAKTVIFANINPYMAGCTLSGAIRQDNSCKNKSFPDVWEKLIDTDSIKLSKKYQMIVGATGWPTEGMKLNFPTQTNFGSMQYAIEYYTFLYSNYLNKPFVLRGRSTAVPYFIFSAFDQPMNGVFGFASNFLGVYNFDSTPKFGMVYPLNRTVHPSPKLGTNIKITLVNKAYATAKDPVIFKTKNDNYSNKINHNSKNKKQALSFIDTYPFIEYSVKGSNEVTIFLPTTLDKKYPAAKCTNHLLSGNGYGIQSEMNLEWETPFSKDAGQDACKYVNWAENGIFIVG